jgi:hypothetical protein
MQRSHSMLFPLAQKPKMLHWAAPLRDEVA